MHPIKLLIICKNITAKPSRACYALGQVRFYVTICSKVEKLTFYIWSKLFIY